MGRGMRGIHRRLAGLEAECARGAPAHGPADHGLDPETYARAYADLTALLSMKPETWPAEAREALVPFLPGIDLGGAA